MCVCECLSSLSLWQPGWSQMRRFRERGEMALCENTVECIHAENCWCEMRLHPFDAYKFASHKIIFFVSTLQTDFDNTPRGKSPRLEQISLNMLNLSFASSVKRYHGASVFFFCFLYPQM